MRTHAHRHSHTNTPGRIKTYATNLTNRRIVQIVTALAVNDGDTGFLESTAHLGFDRGLG